MKLSIGADHAGFELKEKVRAHLEALGHEVSDHGTDSAESTDYPDFALAVCHDVVEGGAEKGILVCSTGVGMSITANKMRGIRAALGWNPDEVRLTREHNDANVLALGARYTDPALADQLVDIFLRTGFQGGRHERRINKIRAAEGELK